VHIYLVLLDLTDLVTIYGLYAPMIRVAWYLILIWLYSFRLVTDVSVAFPKHSGSKVVFLLYPSQTCFITCIVLGPHSTPCCLTDSGVDH